MNPGQKLIERGLKILPEGTMKERIKAHFKDKVRKAKRGKR